MTSILFRDDAHRDVCVYLLENKFFSGLNMQSSLNLSDGGLVDIIHKLVNEDIIYYSTGNGWTLTKKGKKLIKV